MKCVSTCVDTERWSAYQETNDIKLKAIVVRREAVDEPHTCARLSIKPARLAVEPAEMQLGGLCSLYMQMERDITVLMSMAAGAERAIEESIGRLVLSHVGGVLSSLLRWPKV